MVKRSINDLPATRHQTLHTSVIKRKKHFYGFWILLVTFSLYFQRSTRSYISILLPWSERTVKGVIWLPEALRSSLSILESSTRGHQRTLVNSSPLQQAFAGLYACVRSSPSHLTATTFNWNRCSSRVCVFSCINFKYYLFKPSLGQLGEFAEKPYFALHNTTKLWGPGVFYTS